MSWKSTTRRARTSRWRRRGKPSASGTLPGYEIHKLEHLNDGKTGNEPQLDLQHAGHGLGAN